MSIFSKIFPAMFLLWGYFFLYPLAWSWNPDYAYELPKQKRMCLHRESAQSLRLYSIPADKDCPAGDQRYIVFFAREPRGAMALMASKTSNFFYPPLTLRWPPDETKSLNQLWHFTCVKPEAKEILDSNIELFRYRGEITFKGSEDCLAAKERALRYCQESLNGEELLENCSIPWGQE